MNCREPKSLIGGEGSLLSKFFPCHIPLMNCSIFAARIVSLPAASRSINEVLGVEYETFLDTLSMRLVGNELLMDIQYQFIKYDASSGGLIFSVTGDLTMALDLTEEDEALPEAA